MDKGLLNLVALIGGLLIGLAVRRQGQVLLMARWRGLFLAVPALLAGALATQSLQVLPAWLGTAPTPFRIGLITLSYLLWIFLLVLNLLPAALFRTSPTRALSLIQKLALLPLLAGLSGEAAVLLLNGGIWPVADSILTRSVDPALAEGIRNGAYRYLRVLDTTTRLPWLGQIWPCPSLAQYRLSVLPAISPAQALTAFSLFLIGLSQSLVPRLAPDRSRHRLRLRLFGKRARRPDLTVLQYKDVTASGTINPGDRHRQEEAVPMSKRKWFSRPDGTYLKNIDPFMRFFPYVMKGRNESAIYFRQQVDVTELKTYLNERNRRAAASGEGVKVTLFHAFLTALVKIAVERPQINRFVIGRRVYQRHELSFAFVIKREFKDDSNEEIAVMKFGPEDTLESISRKIQQEVRQVRQKAQENDQKRHGIVNWANTLMSLPRIVLRGFVRFLSYLDYHGWLPRFFIEMDPMHSSIFLSNLGSLGVDAPFHHLYEWGTTSIFMTIGVAEKEPVVQRDGTLAVRDRVNCAVTLDERISDGFYFARSLKRFTYFLEHPLELELVSEPGKT
jgi:hypothetical protein